MEEGRLPKEVMKWRPPGRRKHMHVQTFCLTIPHIVTPQNMTFPPDSACMIDTGLIYTSGKQDKDTRLIT